MANWFVRSLAAGTGAGTSWTNATTTLNAAITLSSAGDTFFISDDHAETGAAGLTISFKGTFTAPDTAVCVDHTITSPGSGDLKTGGSITTTGNSFIQIAGCFYIRGVTFNCGTGAGNSNLALGNVSRGYQIYDTCALKQVQTGAAAIQFSSNVQSRVRLINTTVQFGAAGQSLIPATSGSFVEWVDTPSAIAGATLPTTLWGAGIVNQVIRMEGVDISALGSGASLFNVGTLSSFVTMKECKLGSAVAITTGSPASPCWRIDLIRCDSGNTNYRNESYDLSGTLTTETTIVRSGGANDGTTGFSHKVVTTTSAVKQQAFNLLPLVIWNDTTGSAKTVTVEAIASAVLNNDECWMEVEYMGDSSFPTGSRASTYKANVLATGAANTTSTATWGGALTGIFKMAVTITPQQKGPIMVYVKVAKPSTTVYIDPMITVT